MKRGALVAPLFLSDEIETRDGLARYRASTCTSAAIGAIRTAKASRSLPLFRNPTLCDFFQIKLTIGIMYTNLIRTKTSCGSFEGGCDASRRHPAQENCPRCHG